MPLSDNTILKLNEINTHILNKNKLSEDDESLIKNTFVGILENGGNYDVDEIEAWLENEGSWNHRPTIIRVTNMSHYVQQRFWQKPKKLHMISDDDGCGCD